MNYRLLSKNDKEDLALVVLIALCLATLAYIQWGLR